MADFKLLKLFSAFRSGPVLSLALTSNGEQCFSGGIDSTIQWWNIPSSNVDPYDTYGEKRRKSHKHSTVFGTSETLTCFASLYIRLRKVLCFAQIPACWLVHCWVTVMRCGGWLTVESKTGSSPVQLMGRSNCGTLRRSHSVWRRLTQIEVRGGFHSFGDFQACKRRKFVKALGHSNHWLLLFSNIT